MDLAEALIELLPKSGIFHYAGGQPTSRYDIAQEMFEIAKKMQFPLKCRAIKPLTETIFTAPRPSYSALDTRKIDGVLRYKARPWRSSLQEFLERCIEDF